MTNSVLIIGGRAHEIWRGVDKASLPPMHPDVLAKIVETEGEVEVGHLWSDGGFSPPAPKTPSAPSLSYDAFRSRWTEEELAAMAQALTTDPRVLEVVIIARSQGRVNLSSVIAAAAKALFVEVGVLTSERADEVFSA